MEEQKSSGSTESQELMETTGEVEALPRIIKITTVRGQKIRIPWEGSNWKELKDYLQKGGKCLDKEDKLTKNFSPYDLRNMKCGESVYAHTLEHDQAVLPAGNFTLFLMPYESKGGAMTRPEINTTIRQLIADHKDKAKAHFTVDGKNYTHLSSAILEEKINSFSIGKSKRVSAKKANAIAQVVNNVEESKKEESTKNGDEGIIASDGEDSTSDGVLYDEVSRMDIKDQLFLIIKLLTDLTSKVYKPSEFVGKSQEEIEKEKAEEEEKLFQEQMAIKERQAEEDRIAAEKKAEEERKAEENRKRKEQEEQERREKEEDEAELLAFAGGFKGEKLKVR